MPIFKTPHPITLDITVLYASVTVTAGDGTHDTDSTTVEITPADPNNSKDVAEAKSITVEHSGDTVRITAPPGGLFAWNRGTAVVRVVCPRHSSVDARNKKGAIKMLGDMERVDVDSGNGRIDVDTARRVAIRTSNGNIAVTKCRDLDARTNNGSVEIKTVDKAEIHSSSGNVRVDAAGGDIKAHTANGKIEIARAGGEVDVSTNNGAITLGSICADTVAKTLNGKITCRVARGVRVVLEAHTLSGRVRNGVEDGEGKGAEVRVKLESNNGDIIVERARAQDSDPAPPSASSAGPSATREEEDAGPVPESLPPRYNQEWRHGETGASD